MVKLEIYRGELHCLLQLILYVFVEKHWPLRRTMRSDHNADFIKVVASGENNLWRHLAAKVISVTF